MSDNRSGPYDRRRHPRASMNHTATVLARHNTGVPFTIECLSIGGAKLRGPLTLDRGELIHVLFEIDGHPVEVGAEVIRVISEDIMTDHVAVRFITIESDARELIRELVWRTLDVP